MESRERNKLKEILIDFAKRNYKKVLNETKKFINEFRFNSKAKAIRGFSLYNTGRLDEGLKLINQVHSENIVDEQIVMIMVENYKFIGRFDLLLDYAYNVLARSHYSEELYLFLFFNFITFYIWSGNIAEANKICLQMQKRSLNRPYASWRTFLIYLDALDSRDESSQRKLFSLALKLAERDSNGDFAAQLSWIIHGQTENYEEMLKIIESGKYSFPDKEFHKLEILNKLCHWEEIKQFCEQKLKTSALDVNVVRNYFRSLQKLFNTSDEMSKESNNFFDTISNDLSITESIIWKLELIIAFPESFDKFDVAELIYTYFEVTGEKRPSCWSDVNYYIAQLPQDHVDFVLTKLYSLFDEAGFCLSVLKQDNFTINALRLQYVTGRFNGEDKLDYGIKIIKDGWKEESFFEIGLSLMLDVAESNNGLKSSSINLIMSLRILARFAMKQFPRNSRFPFLVLRVYNLFGVPLFHVEIFKELEIKNLQIEGIGYYFLNLVIREGCFPSLLDKFGKFYNKMIKQIGDTFSESLKNNAILKLPEVLNLYKNLKKSQQGALVSAEIYLNRIYDSFSSYSDFKGSLPNLYYMGKTLRKAGGDFTFNYDFTSFLLIPNGLKSDIQELFKAAVDEQSIYVKFRIVLGNFVNETISILFLGCGDCDVHSENCCGMMNDLMEYFKDCPLGSKTKNINSYFVESPLKYYRKYRYGEIISTLWQIFSLIYLDKIEEEQFVQLSQHFNTLMDNLLEGQSELITCHPLSQSVFSAFIEVFRFVSLFSWFLRILMEIKYAAGRKAPEAVTPIFEKIKKSLLRLRKHCDSFDLVSVMNGLPKFKLEDYYDFSSEMNKILKNIEKDTLRQEVNFVTKLFNDNKSKVSNLIKIIDSS